MKPLVLAYATAGLLMAAALHHTDAVMGSAAGPAETRAATASR
ncbi:hypothetical protein BD830_1022 [Maritimibacter alkaliphilus HTCC2654]|uniref:Uncharacterized protein n=1 Tax=Maritimibacter alkaliphilus HTCC2654 TaxID=314271 RepID=A3VFN0_9RHOB|nr:hypothetical protein [Maritimibacter alkaliphilus]EAQ13145.1 hypothetical protein RB2654_11623 [Rhodobacterales bacterium HTCC2654] [Maritimibacter alkaliphilus HTCC2654]TYP83915.1 hypothetical protein BD830_1022 [Maritimibacter alkaliphilus HTCC2654]